MRFNAASRAGTTDWLIQANSKLPAPKSKHDHKCFRSPRQRKRRASNQVKSPPTIPAVIVLGCNHLQTSTVVGRSKCDAFAPQPAHRPTFVADNLAVWLPVDWLCLPLSMPQFRNFQMKFRISVIVRLTTWGPATTSKYANLLARPIIQVPGSSRSSSLRRSNAGAKRPPSPIASHPKEPTSQPDRSWLGNIIDPKGDDRIERTHYWRRRVYRGHCRSFAYGSGASCRSL